MNNIEKDLQVFSSLFFSEDVVNTYRGNAFETANSKLENAKNLIKEKIANASPDAKRYLTTQHNLIELKQKKLANRQNTLLRRKEAAAKQTVQQINQVPQKPAYDENNPEHNEIIKQYHKVKMDKVRSFKNQNIVKEDNEVELEKIKANNIRNTLKIAKQNSEIAQKNSAQNNRLSKQKMVSNAANN